MNSIQQKKNNKTLNITF